MRTSAGWSEVATTTTERSSASPRSRSMNSRTSRPRSPTSAITLIEALVERAIIPSSEDLPTPEPAKIPRRCPRPQGTRPSSARTPEADALADARPRERAGRRERSSSAPAPRGVGRPSSGMPRPSTIRPSRPSPTAMRNGAPVASTRVPGPMPCSSPSGISSVRPSRKPTTSAGHGGAVAVGADEADLADLGLQAGGLDDQADQVADEAVAAGEIGLARSPRGPRQQRARAGASLTWRARRPASSAQRDLAGALQLRLHARVDLALGGAHDRASRPHALVGLQVAQLDAAALRACSRRRSPPCTVSRSAGLTSTVIRRRSPTRRSAPWTTSTTSSGRACSAPARILPASARASSIASRSTASADLACAAPRTPWRAPRRAPRAARATLGALRSARPARPAACPPRGPARGSASASAAACGEQPRGRVARRRIGGLELLEVVADGGLRQRLRPPRSLVAGDHDRAGFLEPAHDRHDAALGARRRRVCAAAAGSPSPP